MKDTRRRLLVLPACLLALIGLVAAGAPAAQDVLEPTPEQAKTLSEALKMLRREHYREVDIDDAFSEKLLDRALDALDPNRMNFTAADVAELRGLYSDSLDDALRKGDLHPAFAIFQRFQIRFSAYIDYLLRAVDEELPKLNFDEHDSLEIDRENASWPASEGEVRELWRKRFKNDVLTLKLAGKFEGHDRVELSQEEIAAKLRRRYESLRQFTSRTSSEDVFSFFMNVVAMSYDPHTSYFPPMDAENFEISMALSFQGIGALLGSDGEYIQIQSLIPGGPATLSGKLQAMDYIVAVGQDEDGEMVDVIGWRTDEVAKLIRGPKGTVVRLSIVSDLTAPAPRIVKLTRDEVKLEEQAAKSHVLELEESGATHRIGVIELPAFYMDFEAARRGDEDFKSSTRDVVRLLNELDKENVEGIVLDLRQNGGGSLTEAEALTGLFVGRQPIVQVRDVRGEPQSLKSPVPRIYDGPLVVLVSRLSASASEILAAAIQDYGRGVIVGDTTFGKGTVQNVVPLDQGQLKLTQAKFYRVSGLSTQDKGVEPDVAFPAEYDHERVGEGALEEALPFDRIDPVRYKADDRIARLLPELRRRHAERAEKAPNFVARARRLELLEQSRNKAEWSLNEDERRAEQDRLDSSLLAIENDRRMALGLPPEEEIDGPEQAVEDELRTDDGEAAEETDPVVEEAARIALDLGLGLRDPERLAVD